jgi:hypothetical protein
MMASIGLRQIPHFRRVPRDAVLLPFFVLVLTFFMVPIRLAAFATMLHQGWGSRPTVLPRSGVVGATPLTESVDG